MEQSLDICEFLYVDDLLDNFSSVEEAATHDAIQQA